MDFFGDVAASAVACVLAVAALSKLGRANATGDAWAAHGILPPRAVRVAARAVGPVELAVAAAMILPVTRTFGAIVATSLFAAYTAYLSAALRRGVDGGCGCFGSDAAGRVNVAHVGRAAAFGVAGAFAAATSTSTFTAASLLLGVLAGGALVVAGSLLVSLTDVVARVQVQRQASA